MKLLDYSIVVCLLAIAGSGGCNSDNPAAPYAGPSLYGQVKDSEGNPVQGCGVHYIFSMTASPLAKLEKTCPSTQIQFSIPGRSKVTLTVLRWYTREFVATLLDDTLDSGIHSVTFDGAAWTNGIYIYQLTINGNVVEKPMTFLDTDVSALVKTAPLVTTDARGQFSLPYGLFAFAVPFLRSSVSGSTLDTVYVSHTIQIVLNKPGYTTSVTTVTIDESKGMSHPFTIDHQ